MKHEAMTDEAYIYPPMPRDKIMHDKNRLKHLVEEINTKKHTLYIIDEADKVDDKISSLIEELDAKENNIQTQRSNAKAPRSRDAKGDSRRIRLSNCND